MVDGMKEMCENTELRCGIVQSPKPFRTIHQCLMILGAEREDVYIGWKGYVKEYRSIYNRYEKWELEYMAKVLWRKAVKRYHPDRVAEEEREMYEYMTAEVNAAYDRILYLLEYR